jgi:MFS family permease
VTSMEETELVAGPPLEDTAAAEAEDPSDPVPVQAGAPEAVAGPVPQRTGWRRVAIDVRPLRHGAYRRMFIGSATSFFGSQFTAIAVPLQIYAMTRKDQWVGYVSFAGLLPLLVFALWGGALADRLDRRRLLLVSSLVSWVMTIGLLVQAMFGLNSPFLVLLLVSVQSGAVAVTMPTRSAIVPRIVPREEMAQAQTLNFTVSNLGSVFGPLVAALVVNYVGLAEAYAVDALTFTVALWAALNLPELPPLTDEDRPKNRGGLKDVMFGLRYLATTPVLLLSFAVDIVAMVLAMPRALFPDVAANRFAHVPNASGWLFSAIAIGSVLAGVTSGWVARVKRQGIALIFAVVGWGIAVAVAGVARQFWLVIVLLALAGAADLVSAVYRQTMLLTYAPDRLRGRMQGVFTAVVAGGPRLGDLRAGLTAAAFGTSLAWTGGGIACAIVAVVLGASFPALRRYRTDTPPPS